MLFLFFLSLFVQASGVSLVLKPQKNLTNIKNMIGELADANPDDVASLYNNLQTMMNDAQAAIKQLQDGLDFAANAHGLAGVKHANAVAAHAATLVSLQVAREAKEEADRKFNEAQGATDAAQAEVDSALLELLLAQKAHEDAQDYFNTENPRLENEIYILQQMIVLHASLNPIPLSDLFVIDSFTGDYASCVAHCEGLTGGTYKIASVHSDAENDQLISQLTSEATYIGAVETSVNTVYEWTDGSAWDYTPARTDGLKSAETRIAIRGGTWHDWLVGQGTLLVACRRH